MTAPDPSGASLPIDSDVDAMTPAAAPRPLHLRPKMMLAVFVGGMIGTTARYLTGLFMPTWWGLPWPTFTVNIIGAFLLGQLLEGLVRRGKDAGIRRGLRLFIGTGIMGGFTTYSTMDVDTIDLWRDGNILPGIIYCCVSIVLGVVAASLGALVSATHHRAMVRRGKDPSSWS